MHNDVRPPTLLAFEQIKIKPDRRSARQVTEAETGKEK